MPRAFDQQQIAIDRNPLQGLTQDWGKLPKLDPIDPADLVNTYLSSIERITGIDLRGVTEFFDWINGEVGVDLKAFTEGIKALVDGLVEAIGNPLGFLETLGGAIEVAVNNLANAFNLKLPTTPLDTTGAAATLSTYQLTSAKGQANGYVPLNASALIDSTYLPSYVDDVLEYANLAAFPATGSTGAIYIAVDTGDTYRWSGTVYVRISDRVTASGITDSTATGRSVITATDAAAARTAIGAGTSNLALGTTSTTAKAGDYQPASTNISDSTTTGRSLLTAADAAAAKTVLSLTKSDVGLGSVDNTADASKSVASAAALTTSRKIDGVAFNGSADIFTPAALLAPPTYMSGHYYMASPTGQSSIQTNSGNNTVRVNPWVVVSQVSITHFFAEVTTAGQAGSVYRIGVWEDDGDGRPGVLLVDAGTIAADSTGTKEVALGTTLVVNPGMYWIGGVVQGAASTQPALRSTTSALMAGSMGTSLPGALVLQCYTLTGVSGALGNFSSVSTSTIACPRVGFKIA